MAGTDSSASSRQSSFNSLAKDLELPLEQGCLSIIVLGASGDLAKKKTFPALYHLFEQGFIQAGEVHIFGYARSNLSDEGLRERIRGYLKGASEEHLTEFLQLIKYVSGSYDSGEGFDKLNKEISEVEMSNKSGSSRRLFYLALPPSVYPSVCKMIRTYCMNPTSRAGWTRVIVEKPFGKDLDSAEELSSQLGELFEEDQLYRIDHYLGKELVQNLLVLRFANRLFLPLWNRDNVDNIQIVFREDFGTDGRARSHTPMALATAASAAAAAAAISVHPFLSRPACVVLRCGRRIPPLLLLRASKTSSSDFNITFAEPAPSKASPSGQSAQPLVPWIARGADGKPALHTSPPPDVLQAVAAAEAEAKRAKKSQKGAAGDAGLKVKERKAAPTAPPKFSKAARRFYNENIREHEPQRLAKVLAAAGVASRRTSEELIFQGKVTVNGSVCTSPQTKVDIAKDSIYVNGNRIAKKLPPKLYFAVNKPKGYICSSGEEKSVISLLDDYLKGWNKLQPGTPKPRLFTVGRLDVATTGLIVVTNDGEFAQKVAHPSSNITKEYVVTIDGAVHKKHLIAISEGTRIDGIKVVPDSVEPLDAQPDTKRTRLKIVVHEGRNHEVRELVQNAGLKVYALKRVRIGRFRLPSDLGIGKMVELKEADIKALEGDQRASPKARDTASVEVK